MRYGFIICMGMMLFLLSGCSDNARTQKTVRERMDLSCPDCNILFLDADLLRADYVGLINPEHNATPNIDKFFKNAIIFEDASSGSGITRTSNYATLTARDGIFIKIAASPYQQLLPESASETAEYKDPQILLDLPTIAEVLRSQGYDTININEDMQSGESQALDRGFKTYWGDVELQRKDKHPGRAIRLTNELVIERAANSKKFFILVRPNDLHQPGYNYPLDRSRIEDSRINYTYVKSLDSYKIYVHAPINSSVSNDLSLHIREKIGDIAPQESLENQRLFHMLYEQQLAYTDEELGKLFSYLENSSLMNNTIIVLYANHGDGLFDNNVPSHGVAYQSCVHVPILIRHPKVHEPVRITTPISLIDLIPTIYEMTNTTAPKDIDGISLIPLITNGTYNRTYIYGIDEESKYIRTGTMKLIVWIDGSKELYNITADPHEENNTADKYPETVNTLYNILITHQLEETQKIFNQTALTQE